MRYGHIANLVALKGGQPNSREVFQSGLAFTATSTHSDNQPHHPHLNILTPRYIFGSSV